MVLLLLGAAVLIAASWIVLRSSLRCERAVGFFHPYTNDGGGGERVLWCAVRAIQDMYPGVSCVVYTGDDATPQSLASRAWTKFGVRLHSSPLVVVKLRQRKWVEPETYPHFTLLGQSLGSMILGFEALLRLKPVLFLDTSGYAFVYPIARLLGCKVACYTHYPTISSDMLERVGNRSAMYNNSGVIARSNVLSYGKLYYYKLLALIYGLAGRCCHLAMVNSSWTRSHIQKLWGGANVVLVYPPCNTESLQELPIERNSEDFYFISVAQFRPEKNHSLQIEAFAKVLVNSNKHPRLKLVGSCRNEEDFKRLDGLKHLSHKLGIKDHVDFCENISYQELRQLLGGAVAGIHSMIDEHFGISVVEYMAAGVIPIAHNSAGPKQDIVVKEEGEITGFLASTVDEFAENMVKVLNMPEEERVKIATAAGRRALRFSEQQFDTSFKTAIASLHAF